MNDAILDEAHEKAVVALKAQGPAVAAAITPATVVAIITTLLGLCNKPAADLKASAVSPTWKDTQYVNITARQQIRQDYGLFAWRQHGPSVVKAVFAVGSDETSTPEKFQAMQEVSMP